MTLGALRVCFGFTCRLLKCPALDILPIFLLSDSFNPVFLQLFYLIRESSCELIQPSVVGPVFSLARPRIMVAPVVQDVTALIPVNESDIRKLRGERANITIPV